MLHLRMFDKATQYIMIQYCVTVKRHKLEGMVHIMMNDDNDDIQFLDILILNFLRNINDKGK